MPEVFDIWDSATNTEIVRRMVTTALEDDNLVGPTIAPLVSVTDRKIKRGTIEIEAFGMGQMKARGATPPIFIPKIAFDESAIELAHLDEMTPIEEDEWHDLTGDNEYAKNRAGVAVLERARILQLRNERRTEWLRWQAFQDTLVVSMADEPGQTYKFKYGLPSTHKPQVAIDWRTSATATGITNLRAWQKMLFTELGFWGSRLYMGADTWESLQYQKQIADLLKPNSTGDFFIPSVEQVEALLYGGAQSPDRPRQGQPRTQITITNAGYRDTDKGTSRGAEAMTYYLPEGYVMITTEPTIAGEKIADMPDGRVAVATNSGPPLVWKQGMQAETLVDVKAHTHYFRCASARVPRINVPRAFIWAKVWL
jgi:hypothetical protein